MRGWSLGACARRLLVAVAVTVLGPLAAAQDGASPPSEPNQAQSIPDRAPSWEWATWGYGVEWLFGEPTHGYEPKRVQTIRIRVNAAAYAPARRLCEPWAVGDCWIPGDRQRLFGR